MGIFEKSIPFFILRVERPQIELHWLKVTIESTFLANCNRQHFSHDKNIFCLNVLNSLS